MFEVNGLIGDWWYGVFVVGKLRIVFDLMVFVCVDKIFFLFLIDE